MLLSLRQSKDRSIGIWIIFIFFVSFIVWAMLFSLEKTVRASGSVMSESRIQIVQAVDGGTISEILVREGDIVEPGDILIRFDQTQLIRGKQFCLPHLYQERVSATVPPLVPDMKNLHRVATHAPRGAWA